MAAARTRSRFDREEAGPRNDVYTGLLTISLVAMIVSCLLLYLDYSQYAGAAPKVTVPPPAAPRIPGEQKAVAAPLNTSVPVAAAPAKLPEPVSLEAPKLIENAPVITVAVEVPAVPPPVTTAAIDVPMPAPQLVTTAAVEVPTPAPQPAPPAPQPIEISHKTTVPAQPPAVARTDPAPQLPQLPEPPPMPKLRSTTPPAASTPASAPPKQSDTDPPPLPKSIRQLPPQ